MVSSAWLAAMVVALPAAFVAAIVIEFVKTVTHRQYERLPFRILKLASWILPPEMREPEYEGNWLPELYHILTESPGGEIRHFAHGARYATSLLLRARAIVREAEALGPWARFCVEVPSRWGRICFIGEAASMVALVAGTVVTFALIPFYSHPVVAGVATVAFDGFGIGGFFGFWLFGLGFVSTYRAMERTRRSCQ